MQNFVIGNKFTFIDEEAKKAFINSHSINENLAKQIGDGPFVVVSGRTIYSEKSSVTSVVGTIVQNAETISVNGNVIATGSQNTAIGNSELRYFMEYVSTKERTDKEFKSMRFETLVNIYLHYHPNAAESKITMSALRKCWMYHVEAVAAKQIEIDNERLKIEQMKADLEQLVALSK